MRKTYKLSHPKIKPARLIDAAKHDVKKYLRRERNKKLPQGVDYWDFDCKYGANEKEAIVIHLSAINKSIDEAKKANLKSFYLEIIATAGYRNKKEESE
jgi:hypothetical protein